MGPAVLNKETASDLEILQWTYSNASSTFELFVLSGVFSFIYNIIQFTIVHTLSPSATAFGGNFNKAALIFLSYIFMDPLPKAPWGIIIMFAIIGNIISFSYYSYLQFKAKEEEKKAKEANDKGDAAAKVLEESDDDASDDSDEDSASDGKLC